jgi:hypothetical protein
MPKAAQLLDEGKNKELWQMCCGFLSLTLDEFMDIQKRLLLEQIELLKSCPLGKKIMRGAKPETIEEFRQQVPLTSYDDYCPELIEKREDVLPVKPAFWVHSSGRSGEYAYKWVPVTPAFSHELSVILYGVGMLSSCKRLGDTSRFPVHPKIVYTVAPRPYISGTFADILRTQSDIDYLPPIEEAESLSFEERVKFGFQQALSEGLDYFMGLSLVLAKVGDQFQQSSAGVKIRPYLTKPKTLFRLVKGLIKSRLAGRRMLPKDLWSVRGIIGSGLDSWIYKDKIKEFWGRHPLDLYSSSEGGVMATQTWDYESMTFVPNLNFLEFIPEEEHFKWQMDRSYQPKTVLLDEVEAGQNYELVLSNFHGGALVRYRIGDMVRITSLRNEKLGIKIPQMSFERRADDLIDFNVIRLTEKVIWQALEKVGIPYEDWVAYREPGQQTLQLFLELKDSCQVNEADIAAAVYGQVFQTDDEFALSALHDDAMDMIGFSIKVNLLPQGTFANFMAKRQAEGADLAHLKPPHLNPSDEVLSLLLPKPEKTKTTAGTDAEKVAV